MIKPIYQEDLSFNKIRKKVHPTLLEELLDYSKYFVRIFLTISLVYLILRSFVFDIGVVIGSSMEPNFYTYDTFYIDQLSPAFSEYSRGDVVTVYNVENGKGEFIIKRVVGLPGEQVALQDGYVFIRQNQQANWEQLDERAYLPPDRQTLYKNSQQRHEFPVLGVKEYFVLGDNRPVSKDSRYFGKVIKKNIIGKAKYVLVPAPDHQSRPILLPKYNIPN